MKILWYILLILALLLFVWVVLLNSNPLKDISNYRVYYGKQIEDMSASYGAYDAMILEPHYYTSSDMKALHDTTDSLYIGYLTVFEVPSWNAEFVEKMLPEDYLKFKDTLVFNENYNNYVGDIRSESYRQLLLDEVEETIASKGFDGIFLDTVDWIDYFVSNDKVFSESLLEGYLLFLKALQENYPKLALVQNRSFWSYDQGAVKYLDGIMWENFIENKAVGDDLDKTLMLIKRQFFNHQKVLALSHEGTNKEAKLSKHLRWSYFNNTLESYRKWE